MKPEQAGPQDMQAFEQPFESRLFFNRRPGRLALALVAWTVIAVIGATTAFIAFQGNSFNEWLRLFRPMIVYYYMWAFYSFVIYQLVVRITLKAARIPWVILLHAVFLFLITSSMPFIVHNDQWRLWLYGERAVGFHFLGLFIYLFILVSCLLLKSYRIARDQERRAKAEALRASMLENQLSIARMDVLKTQINPHFLFNALNSIAALIETSQNAQAYTAVELLGGLLRSSLDQSHREYVPVTHELEFIRCYLELEKIRYGERLNFNIHIAAGCGKCKLPPLLLQPLAENVIKHAVAPTQQTVTIDIAISCDDARLIITISDDGPGFSGEFDKQDLNADSMSGLGLVNTHQRLKLLYNSRYNFELSNRQTGGVLVILSLPGH